MLKGLIQACYSQWDEFLYRATATPGRYPEGEYYCLNPETAEMFGGDKVTKFTCPKISMSNIKIMTDFDKGQFNAQSTSDQLIGALKELAPTVWADYSAIFVTFGVAADVPTFLIVLPIPAFQGHRAIAATMRTKEKSEDTLEADEDLL